MKSPFAVVLVLSGIALAGLAAPLRASEGWLLIDRSGRDALVYATGSGMQTVAELGDLTIYANAPDRIGIITRDKKAGTGQLLVVDKATRSVTSTWALDLYPGSQLLGPSEEMALVGDSAYFASVRYAENGVDFEPNAEGGYFDFNRMSLADGAIDSFALPREFTNPRIAVAGTTVYLFPDNSSPAWKLDEANGRVVKSDENITNPHILKDAGAGPLQVAVGASPGTLSRLPDRSIVYVDSQSGAIESKSPTGRVRELWNPEKQVPGITRSGTRVIEIVAQHDPEEGGDSGAGVKSGD
jgi:hypothetical protein